jgi:tight adherence protein B
MEPVGIAFSLLGLSAICAIAGVWQLVQGRAEREAIVERAMVEPRPSRSRDLVQTMDRRFRGTRLGDRLEQRLLAAGMEIRPIEFALLMAGVALAVLIVAGLVVATWAAILLALAAPRACLVWVDREREKRREEMVGQLPELARALSNGVSAGLSTTAALGLAARELPPPISEEIARVVDEAAVSGSLPQALQRLERRVPSRELSVLVSTIVIQQRAGGDAVRTLQDMAHTLEARKDLIREIRTIMAGTVFSGWLMVGLGVAALLLFNLLRPGLLEEMTTTPLGIVVLAVTATLYAAGLLLIRRITRVET